MSTIINGTSSAITFPDSTVQNSAGLVAGGTIATGTITTATVATLNAPSGVLATQNGMTGICKAWVNYNGVAQTITGSYNVSSVIYNSTGSYVVAFTTAMPNANYAVVATAAGVGGFAQGAVVSLWSGGNVTSSSALQVLQQNTSGAVNTTIFSAAFFSS